MASSENSSPSKFLGKPWSVWATYALSQSTKGNHHILISVFVTLILPLDVDIIKLSQFVCLELTVTDPVEISHAELGNRSLDSNSSPLPNEDDANVMKLKIEGILL